VGPPCNYCKVIPVSCKSDPEYNLPVSKTASSSRNLQQIFVFIIYGGFSDLRPHLWHLWSMEASSTPLLLLYTYILLNHCFPPFIQKFLKWCEEQKKKLLSVSLLHNWRYVEFEGAAYDSLTYCCLESFCITFWAALSPLFYIATSIKYHTFVLLFLRSWHASFSLVL
jgi:hypothetical protein